MSLDVGTLVAQLTLDDSRYIQGTQSAQQSAVQTSNRINTAFQGASAGINQLGTNAQQTARQLAQVELNRNLDRQAQTAADRLAQLRTNAQQAGQSAEQIAMNESMIRDAVRATNEIEALRRSAQQAAGGVDEIGDSASQASQRVGQLGNDLNDVSDTAGGAGGQAGGNFLSGFSDSIGNLASKTGPIAGSILGVAALGLAAGAALAAAIKEGMQQEQDQDLFQAQTGVTEGQARKFGLAAGESYADAFGESVEGNLATAKAALANGLLDPGATQRDAEKIINSLDGVATIMGEDIPNVARAAGNAVKSGFAVDVQDAFDLLVKGSQMGLNASEDLVDTVTEYSVQFAKVGLSGAEAFGLMNQAVQNGARDTDTAADAIKEFAIRSIDGSKAAAEAYQALGLNAEEMSAQIAKGGIEGSEGMEELLTRIRQIEDPLVKNAVAVGLFGTKAEDLGDAMYKLDLSTAVQSMNDYEGAAWRAINVMGDNAGTSVQGAMNSISVASDGMKAALAQAFGPYIKEFSEDISNNRAGVIQFFIDVGNGAFELGKSVLGFVEGGIRGLADFAKSASETGASFLEMGANILSVGESIPGFGAILGIATGGAADKLRDLADKTREGGAGISDVLTGAADGIHDTLIPALDSAQSRFNEFAGDMKLSAAFNDESAKVNKAIAEIGVGADGAAIKIENWTGSIDRNNAAQVKMEDGIKGMAEGFEKQIRTGMEAGNTVEALTGQYNENYDALLGQVMATGMSNQAAVAYLATLGLTPEFVDTTIRQPGMPEAKYELDVLKGKIEATPDSKIITTEALTDESMDHLEALGIKTRELPNGEVEVYAETKEATRALEDWLMRNGHREVVVQMQLQRIADVNSTAPAWSAQRAQDYFGVTQADGSVRSRADGMLDSAHIQQGSGQGIFTKSPLGPVRYAEGETVWEAYIPGAPSKRERSKQILAETAKRFGFGLVAFDSINKMADGGVIDKDGLDASMSWARSVDPATYQMGGFSSKALDCSGAVSGAVNTALGLGPYDSRMSTVTAAEWLQAKGAVLGRGGPGTMRVGWWDKGGGANGHMAMTYPDGTNFESNGSEGVVINGKTGADDPSFTDHAYFPVVGDLGTNYPLPPDTRTEREKIADTIILEGKKRGMSDKQIKAAVMASLEETRLENLDYGMDGDNKGILQQRDSWGTAEERMDPSKAAGMFYDELAKLDTANMTEAQMAQAVQRSGTADGSNYADEAAEAEQIIAASNARNNGQMTTATTSSGAALATDGQRVFVTNWPGSSSSSYSSAEKAPATVPAGGTSEAAAKDPNLLWSGAFKVFENGGMNLPGEAGVYPAGANMIGFAEESTGGEGYIPLGLSKRPRSVAITKEIANRFGYQLVPMESGGLTGFGGYVGEKQSGFKVPSTANGRRAAAYNALAFGVGGAFALASGFDADGNFTGQFDTSANSSSQLEKRFGEFTDEIAPVLEQILLAIKNREPIRAEVNVDRDSGMANISILKGGI
ncbi:phage tail tape measure protein [Rhodococcus qingshengii]|uniref:phage tail tape measure protein n=1 Tax=Rhodococcus qingshengii TaxID=334542 RepID=UPI0010A5BDA3|nr:phage tail tape measure protein [Rhodococcus qingshengii]THJ69991.1 hypothetical protein EU244_20240 [Rhodococcus qingshengii]